MCRKACIRNRGGPADPRFSLDAGRLLFLGDGNRGPGSLSRPSCLFRLRLGPGLICFRIFWGLAGSRYARFKAFLYGRRAAIAYVADLIAARADRHVGHNPAGSVAIYLLLAIGLVICVTGIVVQGAEEAQGIFKALADRPLGEFTRGLHETLAWLMLALVLVHITGVVVESRAAPGKSRQGHAHRPKRSLAPTRASAQTTRGSRLRILTCVASSALWLIHWRLINIPGLDQLPYVGRQLPDNTTWRDSCGACHGPFHPTLLPARSWTAHLDTPDNHFGLRWQFDAKTLAEIRGFLQQNSAETEMTEAAYRINKSIPADVTHTHHQNRFWIKNTAG